MAGSNSADVTGTINPNTGQVDLDLSDVFCFLVPPTNVISGAPVMGAPQQCCLDDLLGQQTAWYQQQNEREDDLDILSGVLAGLLIFEIDRYIDKYEEVVEWRNDIQTKLLEIECERHDMWRECQKPQILKSLQDACDYAEIEYRCEEDLERYSSLADMLVRCEQDLAENLQDKSCICLLYTSPSPRDATLSRMPSSA